MAPSLLCVCLLMSAACLAPHERADRAFEAGAYGEALNLYESSITDGTKDPKVFYKAGMAAMRVGEFSVAERHLSRSLRYGGGVESAQQLATLYLQTSNYARAVQVLKFLLDTGLSKQPIYNNLGTALMYAGEVLDAESYLLIAQQMNPADPIPYVNLGVLYDRYIKRPALSIEFYGCYLQLAPRGGQAGTVGTRLRQLNDGGLEVVYQDVKCGEVYRPAKTDVVSLKEAMGTVELGFEEDPAASKSKIEVNAGASKGEAKLNPEVAPTMASGVRARARDAYGRGDYEGAIALIGQIQSSSLKGEDALMLGRCHEQLKRPEDAERWYKTAVVRDSAAEHVGALLEFLWSARRLRELGVQCAQWEGDEYVSVRGRCDELKALLDSASAP